MSDEGSISAIQPASQSHPPLVPQLSPELVQQLINNQARELELRTADLALQQQKDNNAFAFGKEALAARADDLKDQRKHDFKKRISGYIFIAVLVVTAVALIAYALHMGKDAFATELIKAVIYLGGGGLGGYGIGRARSRKEAESPTDESS
jgi:hypothetical protein